MSKLFTLDEAQGLIPRLEGLLKQAIERKQEFDQAERALQSLTERVMALGGALVDRGRAAELRNQRESAVQRLRASVEEVQELGCVVKDLDMGLIDFPTELHGQVVYLCWRLGENEIAFWHALNEGFRGRKPIDQDFRDHHRGDRAQ